MSEKSKSFKNSRPRVFIKTFGCQMNVHDSEKIAGIFAEAGYDHAENAGDADVIVLNTCSVRQKAEQKVYSDLGRLKGIKKKNPDVKIAVAGCIARQRGNVLFKKFPYVDFLFGPSNIEDLQKWIKDNRENTVNPPIPPLLKGGKPACPVGRGGFKNRTQNTPASRFVPNLRGQISALQDNPDYHTKILPLKREGRVKAWVSIMYGCDNFCAYCVVPYTRGRERSRLVRDIYSEIQTLAGQGFKEVTLLGQNVNSYGKNLSKRVDFPDLLKVIHEVPGIERIRYVTSHPRDLSKKLIETMRDLPKICEHMHLPVQAGSDRILHLMNRGYTYNEYREKIDMLRNAIPDIAITTDIITGFPGETGKDFQCTINALSEIEFDGIFAFKYSERPDTKALSLDGHIDEKTKSVRLSEVLDLQASITYKKNKTLEGETLEILVEGLSDNDTDKLTGRTGTNKIVNFYPVRLNESAPKKKDSDGVYGEPDDYKGRLVNVKILEAKRHSLYGEKI